MKKIHGFPEVSEYGLGTTGYWPGKNPGVDECIREAVNYFGLSTVDTAEMYGEGRCEEALGRLIAEVGRDRIFLVDKILPDHTDDKAFRKSLHASLKRLGTDYIDLYLLHWRGNADLPFLVSAMESAVRDGLILRWGVSNFDTADLEDLLAVEKGDRCYCNQVFYNIYERGCEHNLLPFMEEHHILPMSYSSLGSGYHPHPDIHQNQPVMKLCSAAGVTPEAMMLKWNVKHGFCALFSTSSVRHLRDNLQEVPDDVFRQFEITVNEEFKLPAHSYPLVKI